MFGGYFGEMATREALRGGWLHTGDIGAVDQDGHLFVKRSRAGSHQTRRCDHCAARNRRGGRPYQRRAPLGGGGGGGRDGARGRRNRSRRRGSTRRRTLRDGACGAWRRGSSKRWSARSARIPAVSCSSFRGPFHARRVARRDTTSCDRSSRRPPSATACFSAKLKDQTAGRPIHTAVPILHPRRLQEVAQVQSQISCGSARRYLSSHRAACCASSCSRERASAG